jgi:hypothetical protein
MALLEQRRPVSVGLFGPYFKARGKDDFVLVRDLARSSVLQSVPCSGPMLVRLSAVVYYILLATRKRISVCQTVSVSIFKLLPLTFWRPKRPLEKVE